MQLVQSIEAERFTPKGTWNIHIIWPAQIRILRYYDGTPMKALVQRGNAAGVPILMSIGGWTGSQTFSTIVADAGLRKTFINNAMVFVRNNTLPDYADTPDGWNMDGIDIDW